MVSVDSKTPQTPPIAPLYQTICGAIQSDGTLPADFSLPRPKPPEEESSALPTVPLTAFPSITWHPISGISNL